MCRGDWSRQHRCGTANLEKNKESEKEKKINLTEVWILKITRNILDCDQSNYSSRIILAHIPAKLLS